MSFPVDRAQVDLSSYKSEVSSSLTEAWKLAQERIKKAQTRQKKQHDKFVKNNNFSEGDVVFLYDPSLKSGKAYKFAKPFRGPYKLIHLLDNGAEIQPVAKPRSKLIRVALNRLQQCPSEISNVTDAEPVHSQSTEVTNQTKLFYSVNNYI